MEERMLHMLALCHVPLVGPILGRTLVSYCGSPEAVFRTAPLKLAKIPQIGEQIARNIHRTEVLIEAEREMRTLQKEQIKAIGYLDSEYPSRLRHFEESPLVLFVRGEPDLQHPRTVGIVGTRKPSPQGRMLTEELVEKLSDFGVMIVSGLAHGIDSAAHTAAISHSVPTIGILGHGLHTLYPAAHRSLARQMATDGNGIVTEFPWDTKPDRENFPMRNRVIAAFSDAIVVVESKERGGSMITAEFANRFNKDVFAVPGRPQDPCSRGCNMLIKKNMAHLLENADDLIDLLRWEPPHARNANPAQPSLFPELAGDELLLARALRDEPEMAIDTLGYRLRMPPSRISSLLLEMEFKGLIRQLPGKRYLLAQGVLV